MAWARLDDSFHDHPKVDGLSLAAVGLYTLCLTWAHRHRKKAILPGHIPAARVRKLAGSRAHPLATELLAAGLWEDEPGLGGYLIHDFGDYLPKERDPDELQATGRKGAKKRWQGDSKPDGKPDSKLPSSDMANDSSRADAGAPAPAFPNPTEQQVVLPDPTRPVPTTSGETAPAATDVGALVASFVDQCRERPPSSFVARVGKEVRALVLDGTPSEAIQGGLAIVADRGLQPTALPGAIHEHLNRRPRDPTPRRNDQILDRAMQRAAAAEAGQHRKALP